MAKTGLASTMATTDLPEILLVIMKRIQRKNAVGCVKVLDSCMIPSNWRADFVRGRLDALSSIY